MSIENCGDVAKAMAGNGRDLRFGAAGQRQPGNGRAAQIMKRQADYIGVGTRLPPR